MPHAQQLGRYLLLDRIAFGGMAEIFRAKTFDDEGRVHLVAVKRVLSHLVEDDEFLQMIVDEAKISALLRHDNIAQLYEFAHAGHEYFLAMEYVDGKDLRAVMERVRALGRTMPLEHVAWVAMETAQALHAAHTQRDGRGQFLRIVHRDVSPSNVLCSYRGEVKLCDFGIAKATLTRIQTKTGVIKGKVKYMSPEQALGRKLDHRSDLFSLGTVMYEMLALQPPFTAQTEVELIFAVREARKRPVTDHRPDTPGDLVAIIDKAMSRSRSGRYQSGEELARDLRVFLDRYKPGYRRGHFAQFMRTIFSDAIEQELRQLEEYVLDAADVSQMGENLIADALGHDAPFTKFTPMARTGSTGTGRTDVSGLLPMDLVEEVIEPPAALTVKALHEKQTMLIDRAKLGLSSFHDQETLHKAMVAAASQQVPLPERATENIVGLPQTARLHDEPTRLHAMPRIDAAAIAAAARSIHDEDTGRKELPELHELSTEANRKIDGSDLDEGEVIELEPEPGEGDFHNERTRLLGPESDELARLRDPSLPPPRASEGTALHFRRPDLDAETSTERPSKLRTDEEVGSAEHTSVPLHEGDLQEVTSLPFPTGEKSEVTSVPLTEEDIEEGE